MSHPQNIGDAIAENMRRQAGAVAINPERNATRAMLIRRLDEARAEHKIVVVWTRSGSIYRVARNRRTGHIALSKWRGERWSGWRESVIEHPGPMYGIYAPDAWLTTPITKWAYEPITWSPEVYA